MAYAAAMRVPAAALEFVDRVDAFDRRAMAAAVRWRRPRLTPLVIAITNSGTGVVWIVVGAMFVLLTRVVGVSSAPFVPVSGAMISAFASLVAGQALKRVIRRPRPFRAIEGHVALGHLPSDLSMPSTHSSTAVALVTCLAILGHPAAPFLAPWALAVVLSRLYLGVHYPSDLVTGSLLGVLFGFLDSRPLAALVLG